METLSFTVDSKLLRELGERLVGKPHIALAELVKNSYDADASEVVIRFLNDRIEVEDDGHGMTYEDIINKWLRIGSAHKEDEQVSPRLGRPLTGSKGVGRLAVQLLANQLEIRSIADRSLQTEVSIKVDWNRAVNSGDLTQAPVMVDTVEPETRFINNSPTGTKLVLTQLQHAWPSHEFEELARELWPLQSPFDEPEVEGLSFRITLESPNKEVVQRFESQMRAVLDLWIAKLEGELLPESAHPSERPEKVLRSSVADPLNETDHDDDWDTAQDFEAIPESDTAPERVVQLTVTRIGEPPEVVTYKLEHCHIDKLRFEIRVFNLMYRQPRGIKVQEARTYLRRFGGVHIYDTGFHLPYYGPDVDWLHIEIDHSHRLSRSRLLPEALQRPNGMANLPTNSRLFGIVHVNTAHEQRATLERGGKLNKALAIQVSRDRLTESPAYRDMVTLVRWAVDYYAMNTSRRIREREKPPPKPPEKPSDRLRNLKNSVEKHKDVIPQGTFEEISGQIDQAMQDSQLQEERYETHLGALGALATAGISALAYEHEVSKQFEMLERIAEDLTESVDTAGSVIESSAKIADDLRRWIARARGTHALFSYLLHPDNRQRKDRYLARKTVESILRQISFLNPAVKTDASTIPPDLRLPKATYAEWNAILQNLFINAYNAMKHSTTRRLTVSGGSGPGYSWLTIQDTGVGIDLSQAERFFEPFVRELEIDASRDSLALGGGGLGLTIVRMITDELECEVEFVPPGAAYATAVRLTWKE